jgi:cobalt-zinc-cadmium efflux system membrane fusion protein
VKRIIFSLLLINILTVAAKDMQIKINQAQIDQLDVQVGPLSKSKQILHLYAPAKVVVPADREFLISSNQPGLVIQLLANIGDSVVKGQIMAKINSPSLVTLQREFLTAGNEFNLAELDYKRNKILLEEGVIANRYWQESQSIFSSKTAQYQTSRQLLIMAGMSESEINSLAKTHQLSSFLNIRAPISGVVLDRSATVGARLTEQAPLYRIADLSELWLEINVPQEKLNLIHIGDLVKVGDSTVTARISLLAQSVNIENQTVLARAIIDGKRSSLRAGQNVNIQIMHSNDQNDFTVNNAAIAQNAGHNYIFVRNADGFRVTEVKVVGKEDAESIVSAPLSGSEQIAVKGAAALKANWLGLGAGE